jgi:carbonic anhydrase
VIVVGHSQCGGADACLKGSSKPPTEPTTPLDRWIIPLTDLARSLDLAGKPAEEALALLVKENVKMQVENLAKSATIVNAWNQRKGVWIHGWIYDLPSGRLRDLGISRKEPERPVTNYIS